MHIIILIVGVDKGMYSFPKYAKNKQPYNICRFKTGDVATYNYVLKIC